ncbi:hypothetical protein C0J45_10215 [Silurus meridionalis]|nr:hypothetical protein C0J45_10215 [Silurus meridionalis]
MSLSAACTAHARSPSEVELSPAGLCARASTGNISQSNTDITGNGQFVFGENMSERVLASARDIARLYVAIHHRLVALRCSTAMYRDREGHCSSEDNDSEDEKANEEAFLITHPRPGKN